MTYRSISICGCGWLGLPLAKELRRSYAVKGSTTSPAKIPELKKLGVDAFLLTCRPQVTGDIETFFKSEVLFLNIPFRRDLRDPYEYKHQVASIAAHAAGEIRFMVFASATSVYPDAMGEAIEDRPFEPDNPRARALYETEQLLLTDTRFATTVVRFGGMYDDRRPLGGFLGGDAAIPEPGRPVNLIHLADCIGIVREIIARDIRGEIFNAVGDRHPTRRELYSRIAEATGRPRPEFGKDSQKTYRVVSNAKLKEKLNYTFEHPDPIKAICADIS